MAFIIQRLANDSSTKLYHFGARSYGPILRRWTQQDPVGGSLGDLNSANRYVYAGDDPVNLVDPKGASPLPLCTNPAQVVYAGLIAFGLAGLAIGSILTAPATLGGSILTGFAIFSALVSSGGFGWCVGDAILGF
ncbi:MAG: RHS repeat-associated core domain-containing protein [Ktedonobacteraceae bacterium]